MAGRLSKILTDLFPELEIGYGPLPASEVREPQQSKESGGVEPAPAKEPERPSREQLIRDAMAIHRAKAKILDDLPESHRKRLRLLAEKVLLGQDSEKGDT